MDYLIFSLAFSIVALLIFVSLGVFEKRFSLTCILIACLYLGLDDFLTGLPSLYSGFDIFGGSWNWSGKVYSIILSFMVVYFLKLSPQAVGLTLKQNNISLGFVSVFLFALWGAGLGAIFKPETANVETVLYQAVMPGVAEEIVYRGILPAILLGLFWRKADINEISWGLIITTSMVFGVWHSINYDGRSFSFDFMSAIFPFIGSLAGGWIRFKTGSLVFPIISHGVANVSFHLVGGLVVLT